MSYKAGSFYCTCPENRFARNFYISRPQKVETEANFCRVCGTHLKVECSACSGQGDITCRNCGGIIPGGCRVCHGTGLVNVIHICPGYASKKVVRPVQLPEKFIPERVTVPNPSYFSLARATQLPCPSCNGTGKTSLGNKFALVNCTNCNGTGWIDSYSRAGSSGNSEGWGCATFGWLMLGLLVLLFLFG